MLQYGRIISKDKGAIQYITMTIAVRQSQTSSIGRTQAHQHPLVATRCIVAPRPTAYIDTIVEISINVSPAINPILHRSLGILLYVCRTCLNQDETVHKAL